LQIQVVNNFFAKKTAKNFASSGNGYNFAPLFAPNGVRKQENFDMFATVFNK